MAKKINQLNTTSYPLSGGELFEMSQYNNSVKIPLHKLRENFWNYEPIVPTTSGTSITLTTAIPSGAVDIEILFNLVSTNTTNQPPIIRLNNESTGYITVSKTSNTDTAITDSFRPFRAAAYTAAMNIIGYTRIRRYSPDLNVWFGEGLCNSSTILSSFSGYKATAGVLTTISLHTPGGIAVFDNGSARVRWK